MKKAFLTVALAAIVAILNAGHALAIPTLQLDIAGGTYDNDPTQQTIITNSEIFTVFAYLRPDRCNLLSDTYYMSAAIKPKLGPADSNQGSFTINGMTVNVTDDMTYGVPPLELLEEYGKLPGQQGMDKNDLAQHSIFPTFFSEFGIQFDEDNWINSYNTQDRAMTGVFNFGNEKMYYYAFKIDVSGISEPFTLHFDLYNTKLLSGIDTDISQFAPFSHDAENRRVPEPSTYILLGAGLTMVLLLSKKTARRTGNLS